MKECGKSVARWLHDSRYLRTYLVGDGIDIGAGSDPLANYQELFPLIRSLRSWDIGDGDARLMAGVPDETYDFVHSNHCLEHTTDPQVTLANWFRILKPGGFMVVVVPDEDLYEQGVFPSTFNRDHKWTFTIRKVTSWSTKSLNVLELLSRLPADAETVKVDRLDGTYRYQLPRLDQTATPIGECAIEFVVRRRRQDEMKAGGRLPAKSAALTRDMAAKLFTLPPRSARDILADLGRIRDKPIAHGSAKEIPHSIVAPAATYSPWLGDEEFRAAYEAARKHTLVDRYRAYELWHLVGEMRHVPGDLLEVGVWRGGTTLILSLAARKFAIDATVFGADTFAGVAKAGANDPDYRGGEHADTSEEIVAALLNLHACRNAQILRGVFPDETGSRLEQRTFRLCHVDVDTYESAKDVTEWVWPRLAPGGIVVFDDYGFVQCAGVTRFVNACRHRGEALLVHNLNGHAVLVKR